MDHDNIDRPVPMPTPPSAADNADARYELFDKDPCNARLPVNRIKDEYTFAQIVSLHAPTFTLDGRLGPIVIPRDIIDPEWMSWLRARLESELGGYVHDLPDEAWMGGKPARKEWWTQPEPAPEPPVETDPAPKEVPIKDLAGFVRNPVVSLAGDQGQPVRLKPKEIRALLSGKTVDVAPDDGGETIRVGVEKAAPSALAAYVSQGASQAVAPSLQIDQRVLDRLAGLMIEHEAPPSPQLVLYLPYRQTWELRGYSRGELLNTTTLAPEEELTMEIFSWDRRSRQQSDETAQEQEGLLDTSFTNRQTLDVLKEVQTGEHWDFGADLGVTVPVKGVPVDIGVEGGVSQDVLSLDRATQQTVVEAVRKASQRLKSTRQTKVTFTEEVGQEQRITRTIRNRNISRTMHIDSFEVLATYNIDTKLAAEQAKLCVLVPNLLDDPVDRNFLIQNEGELRAALLSGTYAPGFDAAKTLLAWEKRCRVLCAEPCPCEVAGAGAATGQLGRDTATHAELVRTARTLRRRLQDITTAHFREFGGLPLLARVTEPELFSEKRLDYHRWLYWRIANTTNPRLDPAARRYLAQTSRLDEPGYDIGAGGGAPLAALLDAVDEFLTQISRSAMEWLIDILSFQIRTLINYYYSIVEVAVTDFRWLPRLASNLGVDDAGLTRAIEAARATLGAYQQPAMAAGAPGGEEAGPQPEPERLFEPRELLEAMVAEKGLLAHIRHNESYYRQAIWNSLESNDRQRLLRTLGNVPDYVEPQVLGFVGSDLVMPYRDGRDSEIGAWFNTNLQGLAAAAMAKDAEATESGELVTLPTAGVQMEVRLGRCDALDDFLTKHRVLDLESREHEVREARARALQEEAEAARRTARLESEPPLLDEGDGDGTPKIRIVLEHPRNQGEA